MNASVRNDMIRRRSAKVANSVALLSEQPREALDETIAGRETKQDGAVPLFPCRELGEPLGDGLGGNDDADFGVIVGHTRSMPANRYSRLTKLFLMLIICVICGICDGWDHIACKRRFAV
jgi:hypothetical protein